MDAFTVLALMLGLSALLSYANERLLRLEHSIGLIVLALALSAVLAVLAAFGAVEYLDAERRFVSKLDLSQTLLNGVLSFMLFAGSVNMRARFLREERWLIGSLAIGATVMSWALIGVALWGIASLLGLTVVPINLFLFGALIAPTDPIATIAILRHLGLPSRLEAVISGESLFNDGVGVVLFTLCLSIAVGEGHLTTGGIALLFAREVLGGAALGLCAATIMHRVLPVTRHYGTQLLVSLGTVSLSYGLAHHLEVSGLIAMVVAGLMVGNLTRPRMDRPMRERFDSFWDGIDEILNAMVFVLIGLNVVLVHRIAGVPAGLIAVVVCLGARWVSVYLSVSALRLTSRVRVHGLALSNLLTWGGLRGGLSLALALSIPDIPAKAGILFMTYVVVAFSIIGQGLSIDRLFKPDDLKRLLR